MHVLPVVVTLSLFHLHLNIYLISNHNHNKIKQNYQTKLHEKLDSRFTQSYTNVRNVHSSYRSVTSYFRDQN